MSDDVASGILSYVLVGRLHANLLLDKLSGTLFKDEVRSLDAGERKPVLHVRVSVREVMEVKRTSWEERMRPIA